MSNLLLLLSIVQKVYPFLSRLVDLNAQRLIVPINIKTLKLYHTYFVANSRMVSIRRKVTTIPLVCGEVAVEEPICTGKGVQCWQFVLRTHHIKH